MVDVDWVMERVVSFDLQTVRFMRLPCGAAGFDT
jgi:hypothetical protein